MVYVRFALTIVFSLAFIVVVYGIASIFDKLALIEPQPPTRLDQWLSAYTLYAGWFGISITSLGNILWYILAQWIRVFKVNDYKKADRRDYWIGFFLFPLAGVLVSLLVLITNPIQDGFIWVVIPSLFVPIACYWSVTLLFSPTSFKYTPWAASKIRMW